MAEFKRVVVTGGAGFIGSNYVHYALRQHPHWQMVVLDKLTYAGNPENLSDVKDRIEFVQGDIACPVDVAKALEGADAVVNFAAESHVDRSLQDSRPFLQTNVEGTLVLLDACRRFEVKRYLQVSTDEVYGTLSPDDPHSVESDRVKPRSPYAATKAAAEHLVNSYHISFGLDTVMTRGSNTYGPYQYPEKIIPLFITNAMEGRHLPIYGDGTAVRDYLHVEDHAAGIDLVLHTGATGQVYNIGAREQINGVAVAHGILDELGKDRKLMQFVPDRPGHDYRYSVDPSRAEELGWKRRWTWEAGLAMTVRWYVENEPWWRRLREMKDFKHLQQTWYANR